MVEGRTRPPRIGVFGSAFNPPQLAHIAVVEEARQQLGLDLVVIVPTGEAYHKQPESDPGRELRFRMAEVAFSAAAGVTVSRCEIDRPGPSCTYVTLEQIAEENPDSEIHLLMGADAACGFGGWRHPERILELARVAVFPRPGVGLGGSDRIEFLDAPATGVSSSDVRGRIASGLPIEDLVPQAVVEMINNEGVYASEL